MWACAPEDPHNILFIRATGSDYEVSYPGLMLSPVRGEIMQILIDFPILPEEVKTNMSTKLTDFHLKRGQKTQKKGPQINQATLFLG